MNIFGAQRWQSLAPATFALIALLPFATHASFHQKSKDAPATGVKSGATETPKTDCPDTEPLRKNVQQLTAQVQRLKRRVADLERDRLASTIQEQLEKEEQRGATLQLHLLEIAEKEAPLQARMEQINQQQSPEAIERSMAGVGSVHPEQARDEARKRLLSERIRIQTQLDLLRQDRVRTQASLITTDAAIARLKQKLAEALRQ